MSRLLSGNWLEARQPPLWLAIHRSSGDAAERAHGAAVHHDSGRRKHGAGRLVHEWHEFVGEAGHGAADANAADAGAAADAGHPAALADVALHHRPPAAQLDNASGLTVL